MSFVRKKLVFDTSSLIPACLYPEREPAQIFRRALQEHDVFVSPSTFNELALVLAREKFNAWRPLEQRLLWVRHFLNAVIQIEPTVQILECRDPKDNQFLELAVSAEADILISSDVHLLEMHPFRRVQILQLAEFKQLVLGS